MDFIEHDLKTLQEDMLETFLPSEIKTLLLQLTSAVDYLHSNWIMHRDLKTSNLLMNNRGQMKVADFGMARYYGDPPPKLTQLVVTLWYRAPELLLGAEKYGPEIDLWSIGCIFGELLKKEPLLQGKNEVDQLSKVSCFCRTARVAQYVHIHNRLRYSNFVASRPKINGRASSASPMPNPFACLAPRPPRALSSAPNSHS
jgi:serine/threonine protein kinase